MRNHSTIIYGVIMMVMAAAVIYLHAIQVTPLQVAHFTDIGNGYYQVQKPDGTFYITRHVPSARIPTQIEP